MATQVTMPQLGESVSEGTVGRWLKNVGDEVRRDESLVEIITDKVTAELPSPVSGRLVTILVKEDETVRVGVAIAEIEEPSAAGSSSGSVSTAQSTPVSASAEQSSTPVSTSAQATTVMNGTRSATTVQERPEKVSPLARRLAEEHQVDLSQISGTGDGGRVRKEDILAYVAQREHAVAAPAAQVTVPQAQPSAPAHVAAGPDIELITPSPVRRAIADHMVRSKQTSPHATTLVEVDMTGISRWLERNKDEFRQREGSGISYQTFVIKATVEALKEQPYLNASWTEDGKIALHKRIHIGMSIALDHNLIVPVIHDADTLSIAGIARTVSDLVARARANRLMPADVQGATFTVNNPGVFGTLISMAIINQPNAGILTMDAVVKRPVVVDDAIAIRHMMYVSLSFDHRILDGLIAAQFLGAVKRRLESWGPNTEIY
jgi:2-oxoglutarate dehydrogenase dihydrolipoamide succinyltransferase (E2 component)